MYFNREEPPSGSVNKPLLLLLLLKNQKKVINSVSLKVYIENTCINSKLKQHS